MLKTAGACKSASLRSIRIAATIPIYGGRYKVEAKGASEKRDDQSACAVPDSKYD